MSSPDTVALNPGVPIARPMVETRHLQSAEFDAALLTLPFVIGVLAALCAVANPRWYAIVLLADVWLLGYHHVVATYTRLAFNRETLRRNRVWAIDLLVAVIVATTLLAVSAGSWVVVTLFLYLQWFHYMRQGYGISRMFYRLTPAGTAQGGRDWVTDAAIYLVPVYAIAERSSSMGREFLGSEVRPLAVPDSIVLLLGILAAGAVALWVGRFLRDQLRGEADLKYSSFVASHLAIFVLAYVVIADVNAGWVGINVWHNLQYVMVVWMMNGRRFKSGIDPTARWLSAISQPGRAFAYFGTCLVISTIIYFNISQITGWLLGGSLAATLGAYMGINFHHYIVDAMIWRRRQPIAVRA